jgi:hypothetical protein
MTNPVCPKTGAPMQGVRPMTLDYKGATLHGNAPHDAAPSLSYPENVARCAGSCVRALSTPGRGAPSLI